MEKQFERRKDWHMDPLQVRKIITAVIVALILQLGAGFFVAYRTLDRLSIWKEEVDDRLDKQDKKFEQQLVANEKLARMDEVVRRLERVVERLETERRVR